MSRPLTLDNIDLIYTTNNIVFERCDLYRDFVLTLDDLINATYLGHEITKDVERLNHFKWCWIKSGKLMNQNKIIFTKNTDAYIYFLDYYLDLFYSEEIDKINMNYTWDFIFDYNIEKSRSEVDSFINLYKILEKSYKKD